MVKKQLVEFGNDVPPPILGESRRGLGIICEPDTVVKRMLENKQQRLFLKYLSPQQERDEPTKLRMRPVSRDLSRSAGRK